METSIFTDLTKTPDNEDLKVAIGNLFPIWMEIRNFVFEKYPKAEEEWHISTKKYGWIYRIKDKKRAIIYLLPHDGFVKVTMVFGQKAVDKILLSDISEVLKTNLMSSKVYVEGRVLRIEKVDHLLILDLKKLIEIKIAN